MLCGLPFGGDAVARLRQGAICRRPGCGDRYSYHISHMDWVDCILTLERPISRRVISEYSGAFAMYFNGGFGSWNRVAGVALDQRVSEQTLTTSGYHGPHVFKKIPLFCTCCSMFGTLSRLSSASPTFRVDLIIQGRRQSDTWVQQQSQGPLLQLLPLSRSTVLRRQVLPH